MLQLGDMLKANDPCEMESSLGEPTGEKSLTVGELYEVIEIQETQFAVKDDAGHDHYFGIDDSDFFDFD